MLPAGSPLTFRFLIEGDEQLTEHQRDDAYRHLIRFAQRNPSHQYVVASDFCNAGDLLRTANRVVTQIQVIKPISQSRAEDYLTGLGDDGAKDLNHALQDNKLFDLASQPWLLVRMLEQARMGVLPKSRASVLKRLTEEQLVRIDADRGMRARAPEALKSLAWNMTSGRKGSLSLADAFSLIEEVRGNRGFSTEELFDQLVDQLLLARVGQDRMRFAYPAIVDYCAAQALECMPPAERDEKLDDITASLGRLTRLRWWDETLIVLGGLLPEEPANRLMELILYGTGSAEGERVFLAARCIQECESVSDDLLGRVADALIWRSKIANEPRATLRVRAIEALAGIRAQSAIPHLAALAVDKVRKDYIGQDAYEYSSVRLAATLALMRMDEPAQVYLWKERPAVARTLELWKAGKVEELGALLTAPPPAAPDPATPAPSPELSASVAAFALGQIHSARAAELLVAGFQDADLPVDTRWCITDTLRLVDPLIVNQRVLLPFLAESLPSELMKKRQYRYDQLAYLAGQIRSREEKVLEFLDNCVLKWVPGVAQGPRDQGHCVDLQARRWRSFPPVQAPLRADRGG